MHTLDYLSGTQWIAHSFAPRFASTDMPDGSSRIVAGVPYGDTEIFERLVSSLEPPYLLLYILHTPRGEGAAGRYQSPPLSVGQLHSFISKFKPFLSGDARFDIWAHSPFADYKIHWKINDKESIVVHGRGNILSLEGAHIERRNQRG